MRYFIYIPGNSSDPQEKLFERVGLSAICRRMDGKVSEGPDGGSGKIFGWLCPKQGNLIYRADQQTWIPSAKCGDRETGAYWVGVWNDSPPTEEDLRKPDHRQGELVKLGNGDRWLITTPKSLDRYPVLNENGTLTWAVDEQFNWLSTSIEKRRVEAMATLQTDGTVTLSFDFEKDWKFLVEVLQVNYRITPEIVARLKLFSQQAVKETIAALMGMPLNTETV